MDENNRIYIDELTKYTKFYLAKLLCSQEELAKELGIDGTYFSKMLSGARPVSRKALKRLKILCEKLEGKSPKQISVQEDLPSMPNQVRENVISQRNYEAEILLKILDLTKRVSDLSDKIERNKDDSEKKIRGIVIETIRDEVERITAEFSDRSPGRREAANDR